MPGNPEALHSTVSEESVHVLFVESVHCQLNTYDETEIERPSKSL